MKNKRNDIYRLSIQKKSTLLRKINEKSEEFDFAYTVSEDGLTSVP
jgi:hypothetical protein